MQSCLELLSEVNQVLMRLHEVNKDMLKHIKHGNSDKIELHVDKRQALLEILDVLDEYLEAAIDTKKHHGDLPGINKEIGLRKELLESVFSQEIEVNKLLEVEKQKVLLELHSLQKNKKVVSAYKSGNKKMKVDKEA
ncbi:MAG: hypothetical protein KDD37_01695 [Bdellovibrionales bacterium]|nr:hypothetical protein [Bdellovibrionales bacterium]